MRRLSWIILSAALLTACGGSNPYLEASLKPAELQGKDKAWFEKNWGAPEGKAALRCSIFHPINVRSHSSSIKKRSSRTIVIPAVDPPIASETHSRKHDCRNNRFALRCPPSSPTLAAQRRGTQDPVPSDSYREEHDLRSPLP